MLVVEDRQEDIEILRIACGRAKVSLPLRFVSNGEEAIAYLQGDGAFADRRVHPLPHLLLLDINMPLCDGFEFLEWLRLQPGLRRLVVIVFSSSNLPKDINRAFDLGANSYLIKPHGLTELEQSARFLQDYWVKLNQNPDCTVTKGSGTRVLLRNTEHSTYLQSAETWTDDPGKAMDLQRPEQALQLATRLGVPHFEILVQPRSLV